MLIEDLKVEVMNVKVILTSNGLTSEKVCKEFASIYESGVKNVGIVVTADNIYKEESWLAIKAKESFMRLGFKTEFIDIDYYSGDLERYDLLYFIGGNPFYLKNALSLNKSKIDIVRYCNNSDKVISGASAGAIVLGTTLELIKEFDSQLNDEVGLKDLTGLKLCQINICPHYSKFINRYDNFEERIRNVEARIGSSIIRLNDGEAIEYLNGEVKKHIK